MKTSLKDEILEAFDADTHDRHDVCRLLDRLIAAGMLNTATKVAATTAQRDRAAALTEVDSLINSLTSIQAELRGSESLAWRANGFDASKAQASLVRAAASEQAVLELARALEFDARK